MCWLSMTWVSRRAWQTCLVVTDVIVAWKETAEYAFFHCLLVRQFWDDVGEFTACIDPEHLVSIDFSLCLSVWGENGGVGDANGGNPMRRTLFSSESDWIIWASAQDKKSELVESVWFRQISAKSVCELRFWFVWTWFPILVSSGHNGADS